MVEVKPDEKPVLRFSGWMFASSPALSALEHPVYDLIVLDCLNAADSGNDAPAPATPAQPDPAKQNPTQNNKAKPADGTQPAPTPAPQ